jgi:hypothetical protein
MLRLVALLLLLAVPALAGEIRLTADPTLTPGAVLTTDLKKLCVPGYSSTVRHTSHTLKEQVFALYRIEGAARAAHKWEIDHKLSLENGGADVLDNLWPQPYEDAEVEMGAHHKDTLENKIHALMCKRAISVEEGQGALLADDWRKAYEKYLGPLR